MKRKLIKQKINRAFSDAAAQGRPEIRTDGVAQNAGSVARKHTSSRFFRYAAVAAMLILAVCIGLWYAGNAGADRAVTRVSLDVHPSVEILANAAEKVVEVRAQNRDGEEILRNMDLKGTSLEVAVNAVIGSMVRQGYLNDLANSVLVSVSGDGSSEDLQRRITACVQSATDSEKIDGAVLSQTFRPTEEVTALAGKLKISESKAQLILGIVRQNRIYRAEDLAGLSIHELNLLTGTGTDKLDDVSSAGTASDKGYFGTEKAKEAALAHAGVQRAEVRKLVCKLDYENGVLVYEVEFVCNGTEYEYELHAVTGEILYTETEKEDLQPGENPGDLSRYIGLARARELAFSHAGCTESQAVVYKERLKIGDVLAKYELEFVVGSTEYEYEIHAETGAVLKCKRERAKAPVNPDRTFLSAEEITEKALAYAGVSAGQATGLICRFERDDGVFVYEVEFEADGWEYETEWDAVSGEMLKTEKERVQKDPDPGKPLGESTVWEIVRKHAGVTVGQITESRCKLDDGVYEVEFRADGFSYAYEIHASTGEILHVEREKDKTQQEPSASVSGEDAVNRALAHAGLTRAAVRELECELEEDDGVTVWEISFKAGVYEYEYEISASTGAICKAEKERDDGTVS